MRSSFGEATDHNLTPPAGCLVGLSEWNFTTSRQLQRRNLEAGEEFKIRLEG